MNRAWSDGSVPGLEQTLNQSINIVITRDANLESLEVAREVSEVCACSTVATTSGRAP